MSKLADEIPDVQVSGYDIADRFFATRYVQGERVVFNIDLSLTQAFSYLPAPDPDHPTEGNRRIRRAHAESFADYVMWKENWVAPALLLRAPSGVLDFEVVKEIDGISWGIVSIPRTSRTDLHIVDGQHRTLGIHLAHEKVAKQLDKARGHLAKAKANGEMAVVRSAEVKVRQLEGIRQRLATERISMQVLVIDDPVAYRQVFVDIADNALGITNAIKARFDARKIVNRCLADVIEHPLLHGNVDMEQDRILGSNPNLMSAKHVTDMIRTIQVGIVGRISTRLENELREADLVRDAMSYFDALIAGFPDLAAVAEGRGSIPSLRERSLLGSTTVLRVLADVFHVLRTEDHREPAEIASFYMKLSNHMAAPVTETSPWFDTGVFAENAMAPTSRHQDLAALSTAIVGWSRKSPDWLAEAE